MYQLHNTPEQPGDFSALSFVARLLLNASILPSEVEPWHPQSREMNKKTISFI